MLPKGYIRWASVLQILEYFATLHFPKPDILTIKRSEHSTIQTLTIQHLIWNGLLHTQVIKPTQQPRCATNTTGCAKVAKRKKPIPIMKPVQLAGQDSRVNLNAIFRSITIFATDVS